MGKNRIYKFRCEDARSFEGWQRQLQAAIKASSKQSPGPNCNGELQIRLECCTGLIAGDQHGRSDPSVHLSLDVHGPKQTWKSGIRPKTLNPQFDARWCFAVCITLQGLIFGFKISVVDREAYVTLQYCRYHGIGFSAHIPTTQVQ